MDYYWITNAMLFWILGVPLVVSIISYIRVPHWRYHVSAGRVNERCAHTRRRIEHGSATPALLAGLVLVMVLDVTLA